MFVLVACLPNAAAGQGLDDRAFDAAVEKEPGAEDVAEVAKARRQVERALGRIQGRAAGDPTLKRLAEGPGQDREYGNRGFELFLGGSTDERIEIPLKGDAAKAEIPGFVSFHVEYVQRGIINEDIRDGPYHGSVSWTTSNPRIFATMSWCTADSEAPDRLSAIAREEMDREGLRLLPIQKPKWPSATKSERLAQLLPPDALPAVSPGPAAAAIVPQGPEGSFASPQDVAAAYNQAIAKQDRRGYFLCLTPGSQTYMMSCLFGYTELSKSLELARAVEKHFGRTVFDDDYEILESGPLRNLVVGLELRSLASIDDPADVWLSRLSPEAYLYTQFRKHVDDIPAFLADCMPLLQDWSLRDVEPLACEGIRIEGDSASGRVLFRPVPDLKKIEADWNDLPEYHPVHFRRIKGSWRIASVNFQDLD